MSKPVNRPLTKEEQENVAARELATIRRMRELYNETPEPGGMLHLALELSEKFVPSSNGSSDNK